MRYVDIEALALHDGWHAEAQAATLAILRGEASIEEYAGIWRDLKAKLSRMLNGKCWFCETPVTRSDNAVDHFRPKGRVSDAEREHVGYRWLALAHTNFRYACTYCNSRRVDVEHGTRGGKGDRFPLVNEHSRVYEVDVEALNFDDLRRTVRGERPAILDPCNIQDWKLLGCMRESGRPCSTTDAPAEANRVAKSIEVYHLDHEPTCKQRHRLALTFLGIVREAKDKFLRIDTADPATEEDFLTEATRIVRMIGREAPYSGEMIFLLGGQRSAEHPWVQQLLEGC